METKVTRVLTRDQLTAALATGYDISLTGVIIYDLRAEASYRLLNAADEVLTVEPRVLDSEHVLVTDVDGDVQAQVTAEAARLLLDRLGAREGAAKVELTINTALQPDFETSSLDEEVTAEALKQEFRKRDLQDLATIQTGELPTASVGTNAIQDGAVQGSKLASGSVDSTKLASNSVQSVHLQDRAVTSSKLAVGSVKSNILADGAVAGAKLADNSITLDKLAPDARSASGVSQVLPSGSVSGDKLADAAVGSEQIAPGAVTYDKIADGAVRSDKIATGAVDGSKVAPRTLSLEHFADGPAGLIADQSVGQAALQNKSVTRAKLADGLLAEPTISGSESLSGLDVTISGTGFTRGQPCGVFTNSQGNLQAFVLSTAGARSALGSLQTGVTVAQLFYGVVRAVRPDGLLDVAVVPGATLQGYTNLRAGAFYKPTDDGTGFERTTTSAEARAVALDANTLRLTLPLT